MPSSSARARNRAPRARPTTTIRHASPRGRAPGGVQQFPQTLEPRIVRDHEETRFLRREVPRVPLRRARRFARLGAEPLRVHAVVHQVQPLVRHAVERLHVASDQAADGDDVGGRVGLVLASLDPCLDPYTRVQPVGGLLQPREPRRPEQPPILPPAPQQRAPVRLEDAGAEGPSDGDRHVEPCAPGGLADGPGETDVALRPRQAARQDVMERGPVGRILEGRREEVDLVSGGQEVAGQAVDVRLRAAARRVQPLDLESDFHAAPPRRARLRASCRAIRPAFRPTACSSRLCSAVRRGV